MEAIKLNGINAGSAYAQHLGCKLKIYMQAMAKNGLDRVIIGSGRPDFRFRDDLSLPHFSSAYFNEFVPLLLHPNSFLVIEAGRTPRLYIEQHDDYWHSEPPALAAEFAENFELNEYAGKPDLKIKGQTAYIGKNLSELPDKVAEKAHLNPEEFLSYIDYHRAWKTDYEKDCLRAANQKAVPAHKAAEAAFIHGCSEYEIHMAYLLAANSREADLPYSSIVALNTNAAVLHHMHLSTQRPEQSRSFLIDAGASVRGYGSDISRTYFAEGSHPVFVALVKGVDQLLQELVGEVQPGKPYVDLHMSAHQKIAQLLCDLGIATCSLEEALDAGLTRSVFPHGIGHLLGVQVHDRGGHMASLAGGRQPPPDQHPALRLTRTIEESMVFTIEPGVYFIPSLLKSWQESSLLNHQLVSELIPYGGVRIEDNVIVEAVSTENLTRDAFADTHWDANHPFRILTTG